MFNIKGSNVLLVMHWAPDVDAIAACNIVADVIKQKYPNKPIYILLKAKFKSFYFREFDEAGKVIQFENEIPEDTTVYLLDHHDREYSILEDWNHPNIREFIVIDHHHDVKAINKDEQNPVKPIEVPIKSFIDTNTTSTAQVLYEALKGMNTVEITKDIANYIYTGIYSDCMKFSLPITLKIHKLIIELVEKYGAEIEESGKHCSSRSIWWYRNFAKWWQDCISMSSVNSRVATIKVNMDEYKRVKATGDKPYSILFDLLMCRRVNHVLMMLQAGKNRWLMKVVSRHKNAIEECIDGCFKDKVYTKTVFTYKKALEYETMIVKSLDEWDLQNGFK